MQDPGVHNNRGRHRILIHRHHNELAVKTSRRHRQFHRHAFFLRTNPASAHQEPEEMRCGYFLATGQREESLSHCILIDDPQWQYVI